MRELNYFRIALKMDNKLNSEELVVVAQPSQCTKRVLNVCDTFFSLFLVTPLVISHWYGLWAFMDQYADIFPPLQIFVFAMLWHFILTLMRGHIYHSMKSTKEKKSTLIKRISKYIFVKLYLYAFSVGCIMSWRSVFALLQQYFGKFNAQPIAAN